MKITLIRGDGIGPEITAAMEKVVGALGIDLEFEEINAGLSVFEEEGVYILQRLFDSINKNKIAIKGPITTPIGHGFRSINVELRKKFDLFANIRPIKVPGPLELKFDGVDMVIFRENTEDLYAGIEEKISSDEAHSIKVITREKSQRIIEKAFEYARKNARNKVSIITKANIMKLSDGLFLEVGREVSKKFPDIEFEELLVDNTAMQMVMNPGRFDVLVTENLYGDILSDLGAGLVGGLGLMPGVNKGKDIAIYESIHGSAPDIAGKNLANPIAMLLTLCLLLDDINEKEKAEKIRSAIYKTLADKKNYTRDLGGENTTTGITDAIISNLGN
ncbi:isocitrate/isopropylmalate dehydrogenase family protein [Anaerococcus degeneri]|uniref:NAD-dependent isocitrate dehydrogenase n=1 Tax=Anaerococcus degeneri TaxID=361500 RepID=A0ABS7Z124_9FIRM|nr:isocitrate/isopropylmalate family dehydrogenase [Anaerococcus degeneri]MBP2016044.1 isocitrate dehydrogenase (NAD+) [Anaerococcus degeneri]MCA2096372.1 NAD-dependent isocitrate dehydrogenase [Anaerococcus degeneri]